MIPVSLQQLAIILDAKLNERARVQINNNLSLITEVTTDSRQLAPGCLFIALKGAQFDAHDFIEQVVIKGAVAAVVSQFSSIEIPQLLVKDTGVALAQLAAWVRAQLSVRVVALTGSSGKTSVKEMVASILMHCGNTLSTLGNLNNEVGVPLTLLRLTAEHQFAVIELGANHEKEIASTVALVKPESVVVNNIAAAHLEGFGSLAGVGRAKGEIFDGLPTTGIAIINRQSHDWPQWQNKLLNKRVWWFSANNKELADFYLSDVKMSSFGAIFMLHTPFGSKMITLSLVGEHNITNALAAAALAMSVGASLDAVQQGLSEVTAIAGRLYPILLTTNKLLLDDSYNANVGSMIAAVNTLATMPGYHVMVVGDMGELGSEAKSCHRQVGDAIRHAAIDQVLSVGKLSRFISEASGRGMHFSNQQALIEYINELLQEHDVITVLVKGSRSSAMEQVISGVQGMNQC